MNRKIYKFESHKNIQDSKYYCEVLCRNDRTFYLQFIGNKNSKYGAYVGYKQKIGRRGTIRLTVDQMKNWITEKKAEARSFERASFVSILQEEKQKKEKMQEINTKAWIYYIKNSIA